MAPPGVRLFNSASRQVEPFVPLVPGKAGIYDCGPTVYDWQTIGNLYRYIVSDVAAADARVPRLPSEVR